MQTPRNLGAESCCARAVKKCTNLLLYIAKGLVMELEICDFRTDLSGGWGGDEASNGRSDGPRSPSERIYIIFTVPPLI